MGEWLVEVKIVSFFFFQGFINPSFPFLLLSLPFHSFGEMIKKKDNEEVNHLTHHQSQDKI